MGCSRAVAGMERGTDQADPADPSPWPWEDEMEMWLAAGGRLPAGPGGFARGAGGRTEERRRQRGVVSPRLCLLCSAGGWLAPPPASQPRARPLGGTQLGGAQPSGTRPSGLVAPDLVVPDVVVRDPVAWWYLSRWYPSWWYPSRWLGGT